MLKLTTKKWLNGIKKNKNIRDSKFTETIDYHSNKTKKAKKILNKNKKFIIRSLKRKFGRKLTSSEIKDVKNSLLNA